MSETSSDWQRTTIDSAQAAAHPETAQAVARIKALRQTIDNIDSAVIALLAERFKATSQVGVLKANAGFAPEDTKREDYQIERLHRIAIDAGLDPEIAEMYREFVVTEAKKRHQRIADAGGDPGVLEVVFCLGRGELALFIYSSIGQVACSDYINTGMECP